MGNPHPRDWISRSASFGCGVVMLALLAVFVVMAVMAFKGK